MLGLIATVLPACFLGGMPAAAADSTRPIVIIVPNAAGGTGDFVARLLGRKLAEALGQPVVIDLRPGAAGRIALDRAAKAAPDGHTLLMANNGTSAVLPNVGDGRDAGSATAPFVPVTMVTTAHIVIAISPSLGVRTLPALIELARSTPGLLSYASGGIGSTSHLAAALLSKRAGVDMVQIPYPGTAVAVKDVLSGEVPVIFTQLATVAAHLRNGTLRALAVTGKHRVAAFPEIPTVAESGFPRFEVVTWNGMLLPAGTASAIAWRLRDELAGILTLAEVREKLASVGMEPVGDTPAEFAEAIAVAREHWATVLRNANLPTEFPERRPP